MEVRKMKTKGGWKMKWEMGSSSFLHEVPIPNILERWFPHIDPVMA